MAGGLETAPADEVEEECKRERQLLATYVQQHPCPPEAKVREWLRDAMHQGHAQGGTGPLRRLLLHGPEPYAAAANTFDYVAFQQLWDAPLHPADEERRRQRMAGRRLNTIGGSDCMRLHYYVLNYAIAGDIFYSGPKPDVVYAYCREVDHAWDGIGEWLA